MNPLISIIVPNYNHGAFLKQRLDSIFNQTYQNFEVILLDDCSTDNSVEILMEYAKNPKVSYFIMNEKNTGNTFVQWNKGIKLAKGEYIWIAESDDFCSLDFLIKACKPLIENVDVELSYCQSNRVDVNGEIMGNWLDYTLNLDKEKFLSSFLLDGNEFIEKYLIFKNVIPNASAVIFRKPNAEKKEIFNKDQFLKYHGDWFLYLRIIINKKIAFIDKSMNNYRFHSKSVIANANTFENYITLNEIETSTRRKMNDFLIIKRPPNLKKIIYLNNKSIKNLKYQKALFYIRNHKKLKGFLIISTIINVFINNYQFKKRIILKFKLLKFKILTSFNS